MIAEFPDNYEEELRSSIQSMPVLPMMQLPDFSIDMVTIQDCTNQAAEILRPIRPPPGGFSVLSVDFEFHQEFTYDGFICVASVSSPERTFVVDCLNENRQFAMKWLVKMLTGTHTIKIFCGCANDVFRLQKDWDCFARGVIDIQDLFVVWRTRCFKDCINACGSVVRNRLEGRGKRVSNDSIIDYLTSLNMPGLGFLMEVFCQNSSVSKDTVSSMADWRKRPLHKDLVRYSGGDSYYTLKVFYALYEKVGLEGLKDAARMTTIKLLNRSSLPRFKNNIITTHASQWIVEQLYKWRTYLALNFDKKPEQVLQSRNLPSLATKLEQVHFEDVDAIAVLLKDHRVDDDHTKAAKLLTAYLEPDGSTLEKMKDKTCHNCIQLGHVAKFCFWDRMNDRQKAYQKSPANREGETRNQERRHQKWCEKKGIDPTTFSRFDHRRK